MRPAAISGFEPRQTSLSTVVVWAVIVGAGVGIFWGTMRPKRRAA